MSEDNNKNVCSIEEDIERLNKLVTTKFNNDYSIDNIDKEAIEHLLQDYTRQKQINEEHQKINAELRKKVKELEIDLTTVYLKGVEDGKNKYEQKIKDKIEELNNQEQELQNSITEEEREEYSDANISFQLCDIEIRREVLQELLQEEDK